MNDLCAQIESLLFFRGEPVTSRELSRLLSVSEAQVVEAASALKTHLASEKRGVRVMEKDGSYMLATAPEMSERIEAILKEDLQKDLGKAGLEVLSIILYYGPVTRAKIDYIRGVNSTFSLRALSVRGLIERTENPHDQRSFVYTPSLQLLSFLGIEDIAQLPGYAGFRAEIEQFETEKKENNERV